MNKYIVFLILISFGALIQLKSQIYCKADNNFKFLTNDSIGYWELYNSRYWNRYVMGYSFSSDSTWSDYVIDAKGHRVIDLTGFHNAYGQNRKFVIIKDTLILKYQFGADNRWVTYKKIIIKKINKYKVKLTTSDFIKNNSDSIKIVSNEYDLAEDQSSKPEFGKNFYPDQKDKWIIGDMSDSPVKIIKR